MSPRVEKFSTDIFPCIVVFPCTYVMLLKVCCFVCSGSRISHLGEVNAKTYFNKRVGNITVLLFLCFENKLLTRVCPRSLWPRGSRFFTAIIPCVMARVLVFSVLILLLSSAQISGRIYNVLSCNTGLFKPMN